MRMPVKCRLQVDEARLAEEDPEGLYVEALGGYPYLMTPVEVAEFVHCTPAGVRKLLASGELRGDRFGSRWVVPKLSLLRYLNGGRERREGEHGEAEVRQAVQR